MEGIYGCVREGNRDSARGKECRRRSRPGAGGREGPPEALAHLGAAELPPPRQAGPPPSRRLLRLRARPWRHRRTVVCQHHRSRQRGPRARRGALLVRVRRRAIHAPRRGERGGREACGEGDLGSLQEVARLLEVLRQHGADPAPHAPVVRRRQARRPGRQAGELLLSAAVQQLRQQLPLHLHGAGAGHHEGRCPPLPRELEPRRQRDHRPRQGLPAEAGHRLADPAGRVACSGLTADLRAPVGQRRVRDVSVARRRAGGALEPAGQGYA